ncbi:MAG: hypothetical protein GX288_06935 [Clostridiales bacterium]|nr:hypothetical protein [Clostridiales bacterium]
MEQNKKEAYAKAEIIMKIFYYISIISLIIGMAMALITFFDVLGWNGIFLGLGTLYPFCVVQTAYIIWYKVGKANLHIWNLSLSISSGLLMFCLINIAGTIAGLKYNNIGMGGVFRAISLELVFTVALLVYVLYMIKKTSVLQRIKR